MVAVDKQSTRDVYKKCLCSLVHFNGGDAPKAAEGPSGNFPQLNLLNVSANVARESAKFSWSWLF